MNVTFNRFELNIPLTFVNSCTQPGQDASDDVDLALKDQSIDDQLGLIDPDLIREELKEYGAWDEEELSDDYENMQRIVWIAACNAKDELFEHLGQCESLSDEERNHIIRSL
jgi:hypothetical protein